MADQAREAYRRRLDTDPEAALAYLRQRYLTRDLAWSPRASKNPMSFEALRHGLDVWVFRGGGEGRHAGMWRCKYGNTYGDFCGSLDECCAELATLFYREWRRCGDPECAGLCGIPECVPPGEQRVRVVEVVATPGHYIVPPALWREHRFVAVLVWLCLRGRAFRQRSRKEQPRRLP